MLSRAPLSLALLLVVGERAAAFFGTTACFLPARNRQTLAMAMSDRPEVTLKLALDKQGAVDDSSKEAQRFTSDESLDAVHRLRRDCQAVIVGVETVVRDNPSLTVRRVPLMEGQEQPVRVVLDRTLRIPDAEGCTLLSDGNPTLVYFTNNRGSASQTPLRAADLLLQVLGLPVEVRDLPTEDPAAGCPLPAVLADLQGRGITQVLVEGGPTTARRFLAEKLVDRAVLIRAPVEFKEPVPSGIDEAILVGAGLEKVGETTWGVDCVECWSQPGKPWPAGGVGSWP